MFIKLSCLVSEDYGILELWNQSFTLIRHLGPQQETIFIKHFYLYFSATKWQCSGQRIKSPMAGIFI